MDIGRLVGAFGVRGEIKVEPHTDSLQRFKLLKRVFVGDNHEEYEVLSARRHQGRVLVRLAGIETPEAVRALGQPTIAVPREEALPPPQGHYYLDDLVGLQVYTVAGTPVGTITDVLVTGANDVYVVQGPSGEVLVPGIKDAIEEIDLDGRRMMIETWVLEAE